MDVKILAAELVTTLADSFAFIHGRWTESTERIFSGSDGLKMIRIDAMPNAAKMIYCQTKTNLTDFQFICEPMRHPVTPSTFMPEPSKYVSILLDVASPNPTWPQFWAMFRDWAILIHLFPESFDGVSMAHSEIIS